MCIGSLILRALFVRSLVVDIELSAPKFSAPDDVNQLNFLTNFLPVLLPSPTLRAMANEAPIFSQILCALYQAEFSRCAEKFPTRRATRGLELLGWRVIRVWECEVKADVDQVAEVVARALGRSSR